MLAQSPVYIYWFEYICNMSFRGWWRKSAAKLDQASTECHLNVTEKYHHSKTTVRHPLIETE